MLDWYTVEFLYPKAFKKFSKCMFPNLGVLSISTLEFYDTKKLYQFFDKQGVYLTIEMYNPKQWVFSISLHSGIVFGPIQESQTTREDIENCGFVECFKVLENLLKDEN